MERYRLVTEINCTVASLLIDTEAPLDILHEIASDRIRAATQHFGDLTSKRVLTVDWFACW